MTEPAFQKLCLEVTGVAATAFPFIYTLAGPWWRSQIGRALVVSDISLALLVDVALLADWFDWIIPTHVVSGIVALIAVAALLRNLAVVSLARLHYRERLRATPQDTATGSRLPDRPRP